MDHPQLFSEYFLFRLLINVGAMVILIHFIYYRLYAKRDLFFVFFLLNFIVFLLAFLMEKAKAFSTFSSAFGLLAAFSLLRFRTETLSAKDMTYLFIIMAIGLINSLMGGSYWELMSINLIIIAVVYGVDGNLIIKNHKTKIVEFNSLVNISPEKRPLLVEELKTKTGLDIQKITIEYIDFGKERATIRIYYF